MKYNDDLIIKPLVTEKSSLFQSEGKYFFHVKKDSNKIEIRNTIEKLYDVKVKKVNTVTARGKNRQHGRIRGKCSDWKKAIITLSEGTIEIATEVKKK